MLTAVADDEVVLEAIRAGACGYVLKGASSDALIAAIKDALAGGAPMSPSIARRVLSLLRTLPPAEAEAADGVAAKERDTGAERPPMLTPRELEVVSLVAGGLGDKEIAERLGTAVSTVKNQPAGVYAKWRVRSRTEAAARFSRGAGGAR